MKSEPSCYFPRTNSITRKKAMPVPHSGCHFFFNHYVSKLAVSHSAGWISHQLNKKCPQLLIIRCFLQRLQISEKNMSASESRVCIPTLLRTVRSLPLPQPHCLHLDSLKLKMATWSAVRRYTQSLGSVTSCTTLCYSSTTLLKLIIVTKISRKGQRKYLAKRRKRLISHKSSKTGSRVNIILIFWASCHHSLYIYWYSDTISTAIIIMTVLIFSC